MKLIVVYRPAGECSRPIEEFVQGLQTQHDVQDEQIRLVDYDSQEGADTAEVYSITTEPALIVTDDGGAYMKAWQGTDLPLMSEVSGYLYSAR